MYDIMGDIHGHAGPLKRLLKKLGYREIDKVWQHPDRKLIFVGDYIDRGPAIRETLEIVRSMSDKGHAFALMGNHEYNALGYASLNPDGRYLREHNDKNYHQHHKTLQAFEEYPGEWKDYLEWFGKLPLYFETGSLRAVHACWDDAHIKWLKSNSITCMTEEFLQISHEKGSKAYDVINDTLKGKELLLPGGLSFTDKDNITRRESRYKWWMNSENQEYKNLLFDCLPSVEEQLCEDIKIVEYPSDAVPVFFGHYWLKDSIPAIQAGNVICLDYSIAKKGQLVAYRWNAGEEINAKNFVFTGDDE